MALRPTPFEERMAEARKVEQREMEERNHQEFIEKAMLYGCPTKELAELIWIHISRLEQNSHQHPPDKF